MNSQLSSLGKKHIMKGQQKERKDSLVAEALLGSSARSAPGFNTDFLHIPGKPL